MPDLPDFDAPIRSAIVGDSSITSLLDSYKGSYPVFTRLPVPNDTPYPCVVVSENINLTHDDGINDNRITAVKEVIVYGSANPPPVEWRLVEQIARLIADLFHRQPDNLNVTGWKVVDIRVNVRGFPPYEQMAQNIGSVVSLAIQIAAPK